MFCGIIEGASPASIIYRDDLVDAFMAIHPSSPGECTVIPLAHVDHFIDVEDETAERIMRVALSRRFPPGLQRLQEHGGSSATVLRSKWLYSCRRGTP
ncbi:HIT family protein [Gemmatimonas sp.]|uniref:HIT family protein n=1 Tax=Gemmatimonas sp. TaxID=1962908 RepID=UPI0031BDABA3|nr:HIT family protein [Gemmatimonas sp.]